MAATQRKASDPVPTTEIHGPTITTSNSNLTIPNISYGLPFDKAILNHIPSDTRAYIIASKTLSEKTDALTRLKSALGTRLAGVRIGMTPHTTYQECLEVAADARSCSANTIISLGAGSIADAAKFVCTALVNDFSSVSDLAAANVAWDPETGPYCASDKPRNKPTATLIMIPTSLSAGEHTPYSGITDRDTKRKYQIQSAQNTVTILDPWLCLSTPPSIWLQSGVRGIDHCVENMLSIRRMPEVTDSCSKGLALLIPGLLACKRDADGSNVAARLNAQLGVALAILGIVWAVPAGASHGIGHMLGPMGVGHGETSCILLPAVCKYNAEVAENEERQKGVREVLWGIPECEEIFVREGLTREKADLGDLLDKVIRELGMPRTLKEKGVEGNRVGELAEMSLHDFFLQTNPREIGSVEEVMKILNMVRG